MREKFRVWAETLETFFLEVVIFEERHDFRAKLTRTILFGGSKIFLVFAVKIRRWLYNARILRDKTLGVQVIAIGNSVMPDATSPFFRVVTVPSRRRFISGW
jgi:hypothetical protein